MRITIFGASGSTGHEIVVQALEAGYEVVAFVRNPDKLKINPDPKLEVYQGDAMNPRDVITATAKSEATLSALGHGLKTPKGMQAKSIGNIIQANEKHGLRRIISLTGGGVRQPGDNPNLPGRLLDTALAVAAPKILEDGRSHAELLVNSELEWTIVRAPRLTNGPYTGDYRAENTIGPWAKNFISRADIAELMLKCLSENIYIRQLPFASYER